MRRATRSGPTTLQKPQSRRPFCLKSSRPTLTRRVSLAQTRSGCCGKHGRQAWTHDRRSKQAQSRFVLHTAVPLTHARHMTSQSVLCMQHSGPVGATWLGGTSVVHLAISLWRQLPCICPYSDPDCTCTKPLCLQAVVSQLAASRAHGASTSTAHAGGSASNSTAIAAHYGAPTLSANALRELADAIERYFYYVEVGISTKHIAPFRQEWIENVLSLLPPHRPATLPDEYYQQLLEEAVDEMKADYVYSMRKSIMLYIIRSPVERRHASLICCPHQHSQRSSCACLGLI